MIRKEEIFDRSSYEQQINMNRKFFFLAAAFCLCGGGGYKAQAQMLIRVYPSQDHTNQTLWIFSGSGAGALDGGSIRSGSGHGHEDTIYVDSNDGNFYNANKPNPLTTSLSPLLSSTNSKDIASVRARIPGGGRTDITFAASATNTPTITIGGTSRTIANLWMDENSVVTRDGLGIRVTGTALSYSTGASASWSGAGVINKPIGDFHTGTFNSFGFAHPWFAGSNKAQIVVSGQIIPEPEEYALVFGLFALAFVFFHRHRQKKKQRQQRAAANSAV